MSPIQYTSPLRPDQKETLRRAMKTAEDLGYKILSYDPDISMIAGKRAQSADWLIEEMKTFGLELVPPPKPSDNDYVPDFEGYDFSFFKDQRLAERAARNNGKTLQGRNPGPGRSETGKKRNPKDALPAIILLSLWVALIFVNRIPDLVGSERRKEV